MTIYIIEYTDGSRRCFEAKDEKEARHYFMMEGDHAHNYYKAINFFEWYNEKYGNEDQD